MVLSEIDQQTLERLKAVVMKMVGGPDSLEARLTALERKKKLEEMGDEPQFYDETVHVERKGH